MFKRLFVRSMVWLGVMGSLLFLPAGTWRWPQAWAFLAIFAIGSGAFGAWLWRRDPALLAARLGPLMQRGQPLWDKVFLLTFAVVWCGWLVLMALDAQNWRATHISVLLNVFGGLLVVAGLSGTVIVFRENSFAAPVVRIQSERQQRVIDTGPYAVVRHPMYTAGLFFIVGIPLLLGSRYGLLVVPVMIAGIALRAVCEERLLQRDLAGYADYMKRVRYRHSHWRHR